jgi:hypothetical protein
VARKLKPLLQERLQERAQLSCKLNAVGGLRENVISLRSNPVRDGPNLRIKQAVRLSNKLKDGNANGAEAAWFQTRS